MRNVGTKRHDAAAGIDEGTEVAAVMPANYTVTNLEPTVSAGGASSPEGLGTAFSAASVQPGSEEPLGDNVGVREQPATSSNNPIHKRIMTSPRWSQSGSHSRFD